jgi:hypothetical protein
VACRPVDRKRPLNKSLLDNGSVSNCRCKVMAATDRQATEELLEATLSVRSMPMCYMQNRSRILLVVRQTPASKDVNTEAEKATALKAVTRRQQARINRLGKLSACSSEVWSV